MNLSAFNRFDSKITKNRFSKIDNLLDKLWSKLLEFHFIEILQGLLIHKWTNKCVTISDLESLFD
jgi:hypothetical protein